MRIRVNIKSMSNRPSATAAKALGLLSCFDETVGALGLSDLARAAQQDKTTTLRHAKALIETGFLEQDPRTKLYHIGAEVLRAWHGCVNSITPWPAFSKARWTA